LKNFKEKVWGATAVPAKDSKPVSFAKWIETNWDPVAPNNAQMNKARAHVIASITITNDFAADKAIPQLTTTLTGKQLAGMKRLFPTFLQNRLFAQSEIVAAFDWVKNQNTGGTGNKKRKFSDCEVSTYDDILQKCYLGTFPEHKKGMKGTVALIKHAAQQFAGFRTSSNFNLAGNTPIHKLVNRGDSQTDDNPYGLRTRANKLSKVWTRKGTNEIAYCIEMRGAGKPERAIGLYMSGKLELESLISDVAKMVALPLAAADAAKNAIVNK